MDSTFDKYLVIHAPPEEGFHACFCTEQPRLQRQLINTCCTASSRTSVFEWPKGSICQVPLGEALGPKFFRMNWCPRVVWSTMACC